jgi:hypothetical protein
MADDRMKHDDLQRNMGGAGRDEGQELGGQQSPGRSGQAGQEGGQHAGGYGGSQQGQNYGSGLKQQNMEDDEQFGAGGAGQSGGQTRGGQNR